ncbi:dihydroxyacetone kinase subunit DhaK [Bosea beijingensis]|uniref:dihydroxyacetone kinase subunit DhaK n=1 Tax=Bosea beijingensis TaxID=3068632 RepID=UPI0027418891|nr:dihydroxyacetone kinase subunit DhaK [Bosea sp. REN20]
MKKVMNAPDAFVDEMLDGLCAAHPALARSGPGGRVVHRSAGKVEGRVGVVSGGGSGHLPLFTGYVGEGLLDSCAIGDVFAGPSVAACKAAIEVADGGRGVLCLFGNYGGDKMNFAMAAEMVEPAIKTHTVLGTDDIASAGADERQKRRGVAGIVYAYKIAGAKAAEGATLEEVADAARSAVENCRTIGIALSPCLVPGSAAPSFSLGEDEMEMGMGIHGEPGIWRAPLKAVDHIVDEMIERLIADGAGGERVSVLVNGLGATPLEEQFIVYRRVARNLAEAGMTIVAPLVGNFTTSMEMAGLSISILTLDRGREALLKAPASCPFWRV